MGPVQRIFGVPAVVKADALPSQGAMAIGASLREAAFMGIVLGMAGDAGCWPTLESLGFVAAFASGCGMQANQGIAGQAMVKFHLAGPSYSIMAITTGLAQLRFVNILLLVTGIAFHRNFRLNIVAMAIFALGLGMGTFKSKFRLFAVVEFRGLPGFNAMAFLTLHTEPAAMDVLYCVAIIAGG